MGEHKQRLFWSGTYRGRSSSEAAYVTTGPAMVFYYVFRIYKTEGGEWVLVGGAMDSITEALGEH
jgi:hypothetical protein